MKLTRSELREFFASSSLLNESEKNQENAYASGPANLLIDRLEECAGHMGELFESTSDLEIQNMEAILEGIVEILSAYSNKKILSSASIEKIRRNANGLGKNAKVDVDA